MDFGIITAIILVGALLAWFINKRLSDLQGSQKPSDELLQIMRMVQDGSQQDRRVLLESLQRNSQSLNERLDNAAKVIGDVQKNIGEMSEIGRGMKDLQDFLRNPKLRGNIGEHILNELLAQILPKDSFHLQYAFKSGEKVDAAIKTAGGIIPIDSKFPMENFRKMSGSKTDEETKTFEKLFVRDVKIHIDAIAKKYILTDEGTIDYALMYIPSEAMYYEIVNNGDLFDYASKQRVLPVSPTTFYAYLRAILMSFEGQKIEAKAKEILSSLRAIQKDYGKVEENLGVLQKHMNNASNMMNSVFQSFGALGQKISSTKSLGEKVKEEVLLEE
jgi:DNA recombination protein RmuC